MVMLPLDRCYHKASSGQKKDDGCTSDGFPGGKFVIKKKERWERRGRKKKKDPDKTLQATEILMVKWEHAENALYACLYHQQYKPCSTLDQPPDVQVTPSKTKEWRKVDPSDAPRYIHSMYKPAMYAYARTAL